MISRTYFTETYYDLSVDIATRFAMAIREAWLTGKDFEGEKQKGFFVSRNRGFEDKLYVGNIHRIENHLYWKDEELTDDDEIVNVVVIDGPVTRDGDGCSYGSKDHRDQILYANTIPQVKGHIFILNTPGGAASARIDYEQAIADCREKGKATVAWVDGMCCSAGQLVASLCDRTIVMNGRDTMGCIGTMCAFWGVPNGNVDQDGYRYIELVSVTSPDKNAEYREAVDGKTEKLQKELDRLGEEFRQTVRQNRPRVKEEHLTGKTFDADEVMGELVDEVGDYARAIEAVFEIVNGTLPAARTLVDEEPQEGGAADPEGQKDMNTLNEQQKAAVAANPGIEVRVDEGRVNTWEDTMFGPVEKEIAKPQNDDNMKQEEIINTETVAEQQPAAVNPTAEAEAPVEEQPAAEEQPAEEAPAAEEPAAEEPTEAPAEEQPTEEPAAEEPAEEQSAEEAPAEEPTEDPAEEQPAEEQPAEEQPAAEEPAEEQPAEEQPAAEEPVQAAQEEIDRITETLRNAESMVEERDKTIAALQGDMEALRKESSDKDSVIEKLQKQVADLRAEVKELADKPAPMTDAGSGVPADNGMGEAPKVQNQPRFRSGMSYEEIRELEKANRK